MQRQAHTAWLALVVAVLTLLALAPGVAWAGPADDESVFQAPTVEVRAAPVRYHLGQLKHSVQTLNNCGPASVVSVLSYYGFDVSQEAARQVLRPYSESRGMGWQVIGPYVAKFGLDTKARINGNADILKALVANDIPVIVLQNISETWRVGHFRVVQGYDDRLRVFYVNDSLLGPNIAISYDSFEARWEGLSYSWSRYIPIFAPEQRPLVAEILGADWTDVGMYTRVLPDLRAAAVANPDDRMVWSRLVEALTGAERYHEALDTLERQSASRDTFGRGGFSATSPTRLKLLNKVGRYQEALAGAETALGRSTGGGRDTGALWLQKAEALRGLGRTAEARAAYQQALQADKTLTEAEKGLASLDS